MTQELLHLLQLSSPTLPLGAYSYSEGLENLVETNIINNKNTLKQWLEYELKYGAIAMEAAIMLRSYTNFKKQDLPKLNYWNQWLSASKETRELREQSWQMGSSLIKLLIDLEKSHNEQINHYNLSEIIKQIEKPYNYGMAFGIGVAYWNINPEDALLGYLHSWVSNLINAGIKLIPLGQTQGQQLMLELNTIIIKVGQKILNLADDQMNNFSLGLSLASMNHEHQYTRLFRS